MTTNALPAASAVNETSLIPKLMFVIVTAEAVICPAGASAR
jgi:hypothetical protein